MTDLHRIVYTSRSLIGGEAGWRTASVASIVAASRRNNERAGVTGALLLSGGGFAQALEGPRAAVEATFERIRRDARHGDIGVLQCEAVAERLFAEWSLASLERPAGGGAERDGFAACGGFDLEGVEGDGVCAALLAMVRSGQENASPAPARVRDLAEASGDGRPRWPARDARAALDVDRLRSALDAGRPGLRAAPARAEPDEPAPPRPSSSEREQPPTASDAAQRVLRPALDAERGRTSALRLELDEARITLARTREEVEALERHRDIWADRSSQLRADLKRTAEALRAAEAGRDMLQARDAAHAEALDALRLERDIWADRARALAAAFCRAPGVERAEAALPEAAHPLPAGRAVSIKVAR